MDWLASLGTIWLTTLAWLGGLAAVFFLLTRLMPCNPGMFWWRYLRAAATDALYWLIVPLFVRLARTLMILAGVAFLYGGREPDCLPVKGLPLWQQCLLVLLLQDVFLYAMHRAFHAGWAWKFHAVHHSPKGLDWMAAHRNHPLNTLLTFSLADVGVLLLGFSPQTLLVLAPFNIVYSTMVHANLNWTFGPLRYVLASPVFHRWHHTTEKEGLDKNFASTFPVLDLLFGTFYMPADRLPEKFGNGEANYPEGFVGQFLHPFRGASPGPARGWVGARPVFRGALKVAALLAVVGLLAAGGYLTTGMSDRNAGLADQNAQLARVAASAQAVQVELAARAWAENDLVLARGILRQFPDQELEPVRHLGEMCRQKCLPLSGHKGAVLCVAVSADGRHVLSGGADGAVKIWSADSGSEERTLTGYRGAIHCVAVSGDGRHVVSAGADRTVRVWDAATGREERALTGHQAPVLTVAVSGDGRRIASGSADMTAKVWDATTGKELCTLKGHPGAVLGVALSGDGRYAVTAAGRSARVWDARTGREVATLAGHADLVYGVALSPDGRWAVTAGMDEKVKVWSTAGREKLSLMGHKGPAYRVAISPDGRYVASCGNDRTVRLWDAERGREVLVLKGHLSPVTGVALSPDGRRIVAGGLDGVVTVWDVPNCGGPGPADGYLPSGAETVQATGRSPGLGAGGQ
jgi:sterol desaturase/sphingolipid hydroxylase (fatty acid hydroxylase superfamily)